MFRYNLWSLCLSLITSIWEFPVVSGESESDVDSQTANTGDEGGYPRLVGAVVVLFIVVFLILAIQCALILRLMHRQRKLSEYQITPEENELYSSINQAEFITSLSGKLERNDSIGSSSLNFLSPEMTRSVNSLANMDSFDEESTSSQIYAKPKNRGSVNNPHPRHASRQETIVYCEIQQSGDRKYSVRKTSELSSSTYACIKGGRPGSYFEIPGVKCTPDRPTGKDKSAKGKGNSDSGFSEEKCHTLKPLSVTVEVHASPEKETEEQSKGESVPIVTGTREPSAIYLEVFADQAEYEKFAGSRDTILDERNCIEEHSSENEDLVTTTVTLNHEECSDRMNNRPNDADRQQWTPSDEGLQSVSSRGNKTLRLPGYESPNNCSDTEHDNDEDSVGYLVKIQNESNGTTCAHGKTEHSASGISNEVVV